MIKDRQGNALVGATSAAAEFFDEACEAFASYQGDPVGLLDAAIAEAPRFAMARLAKAWLFVLATEPEACAAASAILDDAAMLPMGERERGHMAALRQAIVGEWTGAANALDLHSMRFPRDMIALQAGHLVDYLRADSRNLRDRIARALPHWNGVPGRSFVLGMYAFGLEEAGDLVRAEAVGRQAVGMDARDSWAHHAVAHVMEMLGRPGDGLRWIVDRERHWAAEGAFFQTHNWWHRALCHIELDDPASALRLYDGPIRGERSQVAVDLVDASALLWRLDLAGVAVGDRWDELSRSWEAHADGKLYPFNDFHAAMAHLGAGRRDAMERLLDAARSNAEGETARWHMQTCLPLMEGFGAFREGRYEEAATLLLGARRIANAFGGSHAQRDVIDWTITEAALRGGLRDVATAMTDERLALRPHSPVNRAFLARAEAMSRRAA